MHCTLRDGFGSAQTRTTLGSVFYSKPSAMKRVGRQGLSPFPLRVGFLLVCCFVQCGDVFNITYTVPLSVWLCRSEQICPRLADCHCMLCCRLHVIPALARVSRDTVDQTSRALRLGESGQSTCGFPLPVQPKQGGKGNIDYADDPQGNICDLLNTLHCALPPL